jgi:hypothetical protein
MLIWRDWQTNGNVIFAETVFSLLTPSEIRTMMAAKVMPVREGA